MTLTESFEQLPHLHCRIFVYDEPAINIVVAGWSGGTAMIVSIFCSGDAAHGETLCNLIFFQLGKNRQHADHGAAQRRRSVKILTHRDKIYFLGKKIIFNQQKRIFLTAGQPIQLVDDDYIILRQVSKHFLKSRTVQIAARISTVRVKFSDGNIFGFAECPEA